jgi:hypothetical protein
MSVVYLFSFLDAWILPGELQNLDSFLVNLISFETEKEHRPELRQAVEVNKKLQSGEGCFSLVRWTSQRDCRCPLTK